jgi:hypothetical protein
MSGLVGSSQYFFGDTGFYPYEIGQSCRFESSSDERLSRSVSSSGNRKTFTWSCWIKRSDTTSSVLFNAGTSATEITRFMIQGDGNLRFNDKTGGDNLRKDTTALLRDVSAWYHLVCAVDLTQASNSNRVKLYINGTLQTDFSINDTFVNRNTYINKSGDDMVVGERSYDTASSCSGYLAEVHFIDGTQVTADSFGETKEGVWIPKAYTGGSYGTNGFYLKFDQTGTGTASASTIGADSSGNNNHLTSTNLASIDSNRTDSPTNNFATFNQTWAYSSTYATTGTLLDGALALSSSGSASSAWSTFLLPSSGKYYVEMRTSSTVSSNFVCGVMSTDGNVNRSVLFQTDGTIDLDNAQNQSGLASWVDGNTVGIRLNMDGGASGFGEIQFYLQNSAYGTAVSISSATSPYALMTYGQTYVNFRTDERDFAYSIPDGYSTLSTANLPEPTISPLDGEQPSDHVNTLLYTGNGSSQNVSGLSFQPDWVWIKSRSSANKHKLYDAVRGVEKTLSSSGNDAESTEATTLTEFRSDGFAVGSNDGVNKNTDSMVAWNWLGANGTASNSDGDITSTVSANTTAGFSIVSFTSTGSQATVGHGLSQAPEMIIAVQRTGSAWSVYHVKVGNDKRLRLDTTAAEASSSVWGSTTPTSSVFTQSITSTTNPIIAYCFHSVKGYSDFGIYTGNGDADGPFVYTGFRPAFLMFKRTDSTTSWYMYDIKRDPVNLSGTILQADNNSAEAVSANNAFDFVSNGFKIRGTGGTINGSSGTFVYMAFAEMPFKYANAR